MVKANSKSELNDAMRRGESTIEIEGDLARMVLRIKATGKVAWLVAFGAIATASLAVISMVPASVATGGAAAPVEGVVVTAAFAPAAALLGYKVAFTAVGLAVAAGGVGILSRLRSDYKIIEANEDRVLLTKTSSSSD